MSSKAYKFLAKDAVGPFSGFAWPLPAGDARGAWVEVEGPLELCTRGVHVCRPSDLAHWLHEELWELEIDGEELEGVDFIVVRRARLLQRIDAWSQGGALRFVLACIEHAMELVGPDPDARVRGFLDDARHAGAAGYPAVGAFCAASAVAKRASAADVERSYRSERAWQAAWIARELIGNRL